jgi:hypothetical protein
MYDHFLSSVKYTYYDYNAVTITESTVEKEIQKIVSSKSLSIYHDFILLSDTQLQQQSNVAHSVPLLWQASPPSTLIFPA